MTDNIAKAVELYAAVHFTVIGLSHVVRPASWARFFMLLRAQGDTGVFANGMMSLMFGSIIVAFHNVWTGAAVVLTLIGWAQVVKGLVALTWPAFAMRSLARVSLERAWEFQAAGAVLLAIAAWLITRLATG